MVVGFDHDEIITDDDIGYVIRKPTTTRDNGAPTGSLMGDTRRIFAFIQDERHLTAQKLHLSVKERVDQLDRQFQREAAGEAAPSKPKPRRGLGRRKRKKEKAEEADSPAKREWKTVKGLLESKRTTLEKLEVSNPLSTPECSPMPSSLTPRTTEKSCNV